MACYGDVDIHLVGLEHDRVLGGDGCSWEKGQCCGEMARVEFAAAEETITI